jgi:filamentous hemagglutinin family protein
MSYVKFLHGGHPRQMRLRSKTSLRCAFAVFALPAGAAFGQALPAGGSFAAGSGSFSPGPASLTVNQSSARGVINWSGFSIGAGGSVTFNNGAGATLNRVTGENVSSIAGELAGTGSVFLINPNGIVVQAGGKVITGGSFVASTRNLADSAFMAGGTLDFAGSSAGPVTNLGEIVARNGDVVIIGATATNEGIVSAPHGTAALAAGNQVLMADEGGPAGIYVAPDTAATGNATNTGVIKAAAAALASAGGNVYALAGNRGGLIAATGIETVAGQVWLTAPNGAVAVTGTVKAANPDKGGTILAKGGAVTLASTAVLDAAGQPGQPGGTVETSGGTLALGNATVNAGQGGTWLVDPETLTIGTAAAGAIDTALNAGTNVTEATTANGVSDGSGAGTTTGGAGDIDVAAPLAWSSGATLTLSAYNNVNIEAPISIAGNGGLAITTGGGLNFLNGGAIAYTAGADTNPAPLTINGAAYSLVFSSAQLRAVGNGDYALADNLNETGASGFTPIGETTPFTGIFNGLGNSIANLTIDDTTDPFVGLFGQIGSGGVVENLGVTGSVTGGQYAYVGGLAGGVEGGTVAGAYATGTVSGGSDNGGLVGFADGATIKDSYATGTVENGAYSGGLVAFAAGGTVQNSYAAGAVAGGPDAVAGGLVGYDGGVDITDSYATGAATGGSDASVGGLVGVAQGGAIEDAYATGAVTGGSDDGGLVGDAAGASATDDFYDSTTTGTTSGPGTGLSTAHWLAEGPTVPGSPYSFVNQSAWVTGAPYPVLAALPYLVVTQSGAQVYGGTASISLPAITDPAGNNAAGLVDLSGFSSLTNVTSASDVGAYALGGAGARAPGYQIDYAGSLTVTPAPLTITLANQSSVYGQNPAPNDADYSVMGTLYNGDILTGVALATNATAASAVGGGYTVYATGETGAGLGNYDITVNDGVFSVTPAALTITANAQNSIYGQSPSLGDTAFSANGLVTSNGDSVTSVSLGTNATAASPVGGYTITPSSAVGTGLGNYMITYETGPLTIDPAALTITANGQQSTYGDTPSLGDSAFTVSGLVNGDTADSVTLTTAATASSPVGGYTITPSAAVGTGLGNYTITYDSGTLTINPAALTITANDQNSTYGQTPDLGDTAFSTSGLLNADTADSVTLTTDATSASPVGSYTITPSGAAGSGLGNYTITYNTGTLTIDPATLTITADEETKEAGSEVDLGDSAFTAAGLVNGDSVSAVTLTSDGADAAASVQDSPYAIVPSDAVGSGLSNYTIAYVNGALTVQATVSITSVAEDAVYLPDGNDITEVSQVLQTGPTSNEPAALPLIISQTDDASITPTSGGLAISTGLPLAGQGDETALLGDRGRHLQVTLPPTPAPATGGGL